MIWLKLDSDEFKYEIEDVLRLFYRNERLNSCQVDPPEAFRGIFIVCCRLDADGQPAVKVQFQEESVARASVIPAGKDSKQLKREVKRELYLILSLHTGREYPWGMLTGIRPGKIVQELLGDGVQKREIMDRLTRFYRVSPQKAELLYRTACYERAVLAASPPGAVSLYIGIPFCPTVCLYCSFSSSPIARYSAKVHAYLEALRIEMEGTAEILRNQGLKIRNIYVGGGTPTSLEPKALRRLLSLVEQSFELDALKEYTLEAGRPDSLNDEKFEVISASRVDRISINPQTMKDATLRLIGRNHTAGDVERAFRAARKAGFKNINMDIIAGLPGETLQDFTTTLDRLEELGPDSLTVHTLAVKRASRLKEAEEAYRFVSGDEAALMLEAAESRSASMGLVPYYLYRQKNMVGNLENVGYCRPGLECSYNIEIMEERQTIAALGAGGITKAVFPDENRLERAFNVKNVEEYIQRIDEMLERKRRVLGGLNK